ncbi:hypothetical protein [Tenacibaculum aiptasiae]|uniref:hypothetical protein n=1 Tax=Tenacibaculum aiptasiae TaxID=426481 RepID=UPI003B5AE3DB
MLTNTVFNNLLKLSLLFFIIISCKIETDKKVETASPKINLATDITDFKAKMTELDTLKIWFNHSICTYRGFERIEITKQSDSLKIKTEYREETFEENPKWELYYEKTIPITDTIWKFEEFLKRNQKRKNLKKLGILQITFNGTRVHYITDRLSDLNRFRSDYFQTMKILHPENKNGIYGIVAIEE